MADDSVPRKLQTLWQLGNLMRTKVSGQFFLMIRKQSCEPSDKAN